jgi:hypothetical protein
MSILKSLGCAAIMSFVVLGGIDIVGRAAVPGYEGVIATAYAVVGRPLTPVSVAGVARRSARRCAVGIYQC